MFFSVATISSLYLLLITLLMNSSLAIDTLTGGYGLSYKIQILMSLIQGMWTSMSLSGLVLLILIAFLTGANLSLLFEKIRILKKFDKLQIVVGGNSLLGIAGSGCIACGLPILSLLGLSSSLVYLPFRGAEILYLSLAFLSISLFVLIKGRNKLCAINYKNKLKR